MTQLLTQANAPHEMPVVLAPEPVVVEAPAPEWHTFEATAYVALCDTGCTGITKTGIDVRNTTTHKGKRVIAVDPSVIPLGSSVEIRLADGSTFEATAQDTGGNIRNNRIDLLVSTEDEAWQFGRQTVEIRIMEAE
ncbi:3D domain-containing protein [Neobacillus sp. DY30]|uniref:3D domain-containing protein n=1 Tax=Neobacillus sp. DY30 TaxID=3047871 RepID=UPI0024BF3B27|nr:3D domain-containing protein [Neobacillus sp. DY30]WHY01848.1 3D domain-containing protein [Neobacillus sp. DY30]